MTADNQLQREVRRRGWTDTEWASRAGVRKETLSRLRHRGTCDFATLDALAQAVEAKLGVLADVSAATTPDGHFPMAVDRDYEEKLLELCASRSLDTQSWLELGPRFFMAGLAVMLASRPTGNRRGLLALAEQLHPGISAPVVFSRWLERSPVRPTRFFPMLEAQVRHAA